MRASRLVNTKKKRIIAAVIGVIAASAIGVAIAAWTTGGTGNGAAQAGTAASLTIGIGAPTSSLYPNGSADVAATITNPNPYNVHVSSIALGAVTPSPIACNATSISVTSPQTNGTTGWEVPANGNLNVDLANAISMDNTANDSCQGATFSVVLTATGASG